MPAEALNVEVVYSARPGHMALVSMLVQDGTTVAEALKASGLLDRHGLQLDLVRVGVWGKLKDLGVVLKARDRIEIYRSLVVDPKEARRQRYRKDGPGRNRRPA